MKKSIDDDDDDDDFGRARAGATTSLEGSDAFAAASASVETWGRGDRTGTDSREDGIEDDDAARVAIENAARAMREARRGGGRREDVGGARGERAEPRRKERKRRRFLRNRDAFSCALCSANETSQWRTLASMDDGDRDEAASCNKCQPLQAASCRRARTMSARLDVVTVLHCLYTRSRSTRFASRHRVRHVSRRRVPRGTDRPRRMSTMRAKPRARGAPSTTSTTSTPSTPSDDFPRARRRRGRPRLAKTSVDVAKRVDKTAENDASSSSWSARAVGLPGRPVRVGARERARDDRVVAVTCSQTRGSRLRIRGRSRGVPASEVSPAMTFVPVDGALVIRGEDETCLEHETGRDERALHEFVDYGRGDSIHVRKRGEARSFTPLSERERDLCVAFARTHAREMRENTVFFDQFLRTVLAMYDLGAWTERDSLERHTQRKEGEPKRRMTDGDPSARALYLHLYYISTC